MPKRRNYIDGRPAQAPELLEKEGLMRSRENLMEQYEDAVFAVIMDEIMTREGEELIRENERLKSDPDFVIPEQADVRCLKTIAAAFRKQRHARARRTAWRVLQRVSVAAFAGLVLFMGAYAAFPEVRTATLNLLIEVSEVATSMRFGESRPPVSLEGDDLLPYELGELPDGFELTETGNDERRYWKYYTDTNGFSIELDVTEGSASMTHTFDTEDADSIENIEVNGNAGLLVEKDGRISADIADEERLIFIHIVSHGLSREDALNVIFGLIYTGKSF